MNAFFYGPFHYGQPVPPNAPRDLQRILQNQLPLELTVPPQNAQMPQSHQTPQHPQAGQRPQNPSLSASQSGVTPSSIPPQQQQAQQQAQQPPQGFQQPTTVPANTTLLPRIRLGSNRVPAVCGSSFIIPVQPDNSLDEQFRTRTTRPLLLEVNLRGLPPAFMQRGPIYVTASLHLYGLHPQTCIHYFNEAVVYGTQKAMMQHYFNKPAVDLTRHDRSVHITFELGLDNAWLHCPILGKLGNRVYMNPSNCIAQISDWVLLSAGRVPIHVEVDIYVEESMQTRIRKQIEGLSNTEGPPLKRR